MNISYLYLLSGKWILFFNKNKTKKPRSSEGDDVSPAHPLGYSYSSHDFQATWNFLREGSAEWKILLYYI